MGAVREMSRRKFGIGLGLIIVSGVGFAAGGLGRKAKAECFDLGDFAKIQNNWTGPSGCEGGKVWSFATNLCDGVCVREAIIVNSAPGASGFVVTDFVVLGRCSRTELRFYEKHGEELLLRFAFNGPGEDYPGSDSVHLQSGIVFASGAEIWASVSCVNGGVIEAITLSGYEP